VVGDLLGHFQLAAVLQIRRDAGRAESMIANPRFDADRNPESLASVEFSEREGFVAETKRCSVKTTITTARTKTAWYLNFDVSAFDFIEGKEWRSRLGAKLATNDSRWSEELQ
jgi:hypothetical protein